jgi:sulfate transport system permease protein
VIPGRGLALGTTVVWVCVVVLLPIAAIVATAGASSLDHFLSAAFAPRALHAEALSLLAAFAASAFDLVAGLFIAAVLVHRRDPFARFLDALIDVPFALPTAVTGITLATIYGPHGILGAPLLALGIPVAYTPVGIVLALAFVGLPFVVRTVQPVIAELPRDLHEAAASLGASRWTTLRRVTLPLLSPALATGFALALARTLGEYGSVIFIAGNMPYKTEIAPLLIVTRLQEYDDPGAAAIAVVALGASFVMLLALNLLQRRVVALRSATA